MSALRPTRRIITQVPPIAALLSILLVVAPSSEGRTPTVYGSPALWATVNVCDTVDRPDVVGVRASMPGSGVRRERLFLRIRLEYQTEDATWRPVGPQADSGWIGLGRGDRRTAQAGRDFELLPPAGGRAVTLRGAVEFQWRRGERVVRRARKRTAAGHPGTRGSDPAGFTAATCAVR